MSVLNNLAKKFTLTAVALAVMAHARSLHEQSASEVQKNLELFRLIKNSQATTARMPTAGST